MHPNRFAATKASPSNTRSQFAFRYLHHSILSSGCQQITQLCTQECEPLLCTGFETVFNRHSTAIFFSPFRSIPRVTLALSPHRSCLFATFDLVELAHNTSRNSKRKGIWGKGKARKSSESMQGYQSHRFSEARLKRGVESGNEPAQDPSEKV